MCEKECMNVESLLLPPTVTAENSEHRFNTERRLADLREALGYYAVYLGVTREQSPDDNPLRGLTVLFEHIRSIGQEVSSPNNTLAESMESNGTTPKQQAALKKKIQENVEYNKKILDQIGPHTSTIIGSQLLAYVGLKHFICSIGHESGLLVPYGAELYMFYVDGEKYADVTTKHDPHPFDGTSIANGLVKTSVADITAELENMPRTAAKVDVDQLLASKYQAGSTESIKLALQQQYPWLSIANVDMSLYPAAISTYGHTRSYRSDLVAEIYQPEVGRAVLQARHQFKRALDNNNPEEALNILQQPNGYIAYVDARYPHLEIKNLVTQFCNKGHPDLAIAAVHNYFDSLQTFDDARLYGLKGNLFRKIARTTGSISACLYAEDAYDAAIAHSRKLPDGSEKYPNAVQNWVEKKNEMQRVRKQSFTKVRQEQPEEQSLCVTLTPQ